MGAKTMRKLYLHPAKMEHNAPSGCILVSDTDNPEDGSAFISVDPLGMILSDQEAEAIAAEVCRRWNAAN